MYGLSNGTIALPMTLSDAEGHFAGLNLCSTKNSGNSVF